MFSPPMPLASGQTHSASGLRLVAVALAGGVLNVLPACAIAGCEQIEKLRAMAKKEFLDERGTRDKLDPLRYASSYRMPNAQECYIDTTEERDIASFRCVWRLSRGNEAGAQAKNFFDQTVTSFEVCLSKAHRRKRYTGKGEVAEFEVKAPEGSSKPLHSLEISYSFYAPWWEMEIEYQVAKE